MIAEMENASKDAKERLKELAKQADVDAKRLEDLHIVKFPKKWNGQSLKELQRRQRC